jgi:hypothetical protein
MTQPSDPFDEPLDQLKVVLAIVIIALLFVLQQCAEGRLQ